MMRFLILLFKGAVLLGAWKVSGCWLLHLETKNATRGFMKSFGHPMVEIQHLKPPLWRETTQAEALGTKLFATLKHHPWL